MEAELLWKSVQRLKMEDQQVLYLRYFLDCSEAEIADVLGVAHGTVKSRQHRALKRLRRLLEQAGSPLLLEGSDVHEINSTHG